MARNRERLRESDYKWHECLPGEVLLGALCLYRPLVVFDLETTGFSKEKDRIVEIAAIKIFPDRGEEVYAARINPGRSIPRQASAIHNIFHKDVVGAHPLSWHAEDILDFFEEASDVLGFNSMAFDCQFLQAELKRWDPAVVFPAPGTHHIDAMRIFHKREKKNFQQRGLVDLKASTDLYSRHDIVDFEVRFPPQPRKPKMNLSAALEFYCEMELENAHSAYQDAQATLYILLGQLDMYPDLPKTAEGLHKYCQPAKKSASKRTTPVSNTVPTLPAADALADAFGALGIGSSPRTPCSGRKKQNGGKAGRATASEILPDSPQTAGRSKPQNSPVQSSSGRRGRVKNSSQKRNNLDIGNEQDFGWPEQTESLQHPWLAAYTSIQEGNVDNNFNDHREPIDQPSMQQARQERVHILLEDGWPVFNFGKFYGYEVAWVAKTNPGYLKWMLRTRNPPFPFEVLETVEDALHEAWITCPRI